MKIQKHSTVQNIFDQFNSRFPHLKLQFYKKDHQNNEGSKSEDMVSHQTHLSQISPDLTEKEFYIDSEQSVSDFEQMMKNEFNLNIQVFRKSNDLWLQTTSTDHWSLKKQNGKGQRSTLEYNIDPIDITDFDVS